MNQSNYLQTWNTTTNASGYWSIDMKNSTDNITAIAYYNTTLIGQAKPFISGTC